MAKSHRPSPGVNFFKWYIFVVKAKLPDNSQRLRCKCFIQFYYADILGGQACLFEQQLNSADRSYTHDCGIISGLGGESVLVGIRKPKFIGFLAAHHQNCRSTGCQGRRRCGGNNTTFLKRGFHLHHLLFIGIVTDPLVVFH